MDDSQSYRLLHNRESIQSRIYHLVEELNHKGYQSEIRQLSTGNLYNEKNIQYCCKSRHPQNKYLENPHYFIGNLLMTDGQGYKDIPIDASFFSHPTYPLLFSSPLTDLSILNAKIQKGKKNQMEVSFGFVGNLHEQGILQIGCLQKTIEVYPTKKNSPRMNFEISAGTYEKIQACEKPWLVYKTRPNDDVIRNDSLELQVRNKQKETTVNLIQPFTTPDAALITNHLKTIYPDQPFPSTWKEISCDTGSRLWVYQPFYFQWRKKENILEKEPTCQWVVWGNLKDQNHSEVKANNPIKVVSNGVWNTKRLQQAFISDYQLQLLWENQYLPSVNTSSETCLISYTGPSGKEGCALRGSQQGKLYIMFIYLEGVWKRTLSSSFPEGQREALHGLVRAVEQELELRRHIQNKQKNVPMSQEIEISREIRHLGYDTTVLKNLAQYTGGKILFDSLGLLLPPAKGEIELLTEKKIPLYRNGAITFIIIMLFFLYWLFRKLKDIDT